MAYKTLISKSTRTEADGLLVAIAKPLDPPLKWSGALPCKVLDLTNGLFEDPRCLRVLYGCQGRGEFTEPLVSREPKMNLPHSKLQTRGLRTQHVQSRAVPSKGFTGVCCSVALKLWPQNQIAFPSFPIAKSCLLVTPKTTSWPNTALPPCSARLANCPRKLLSTRRETEGVSPGRQFDCDGIFWLVTCERVGEYCQVHTLPCLFIHVVR